MKKNKVKIGKNLEIGGGMPVAIQSMCTTKTEDWKSTVEQIHKLEHEKCDIVRVAVPSQKATSALSEIKKNINIPLIADIHFDYKLAIESLKNGADKVRVNPGNIGGEEKFTKVIEAAKKTGAAVRIGINAGSLENEFLEKYGHPTAEAMVESALKGIAVCEKLNFCNIVVSLKTTDVPETIKAYRLFAKKTQYPLHVGVTEGGIRLPGIVRNAIGIGTLLQEGIGDTIRVSFTGDPVEQVRTAKEILKALHLYDKEPTIISCPTCGRTEIDVKKLADEVTKKTSHIKKPLKITVLGCAVNGPGEAKEADYGIAGGREKGVLFRKGKIVKVVPESELIKELLVMIGKDHK